MLSECPFSLMHPLGTKSESEHYQKIGSQPFYKITFKRKMSAKHLSELKTRTTSVLVSYRSDRSAKDLIDIYIYIYVCVYIYIYIYRERERERERERNTHMSCRRLLLV